jgi:hypothetical protein
VPTASETFFAWVDAPAPVMVLEPTEPDAEDVFGACVLDAVPLTPTDPFAALAFFCCVDELAPETSAAAEAAEVLTV